MPADDASFERARLLSRIALAACLVTGILAIVKAIVAWPAIPDRVPVHFGASGAPDDWAAKNLATIFVLPLMSALMGPGIAALALASVSPSHLPGPDRPELRRALPPLAIFLAVIALLTTTLLGGIAWGATRVAEGKASTIGWWPMIGGVGVGLWAIGGAIYFLAKHSPIHARSQAADDPSRWKWGVFYVAPDDPSLFVEKRWGGGYTLNFGIAAGRNIGIAMLGFFALMLALVAWVIASS